MDASADFKSRIEQAAQKLGLGLSELQIDQLQKYVHSLLKWNRTYNLTALREPDQILVHHIFDSLALIPFISKYLDTERNKEKDSLRRKLLFLYLVLAEYPFGQIQQNL